MSEQVLDQVRDRVAAVPSSWCEASLPEWLKTRLRDRSRIEAYSVRGHRAVVLKTKMQNVAGHWRPIWIAEMYINNPHQLGPVAREGAGGPGAPRQAFARWSEMHEVQTKPIRREGVQS